MNQLDFLFFSKRLTNKYIPKHSHECYELIYYFQGQGNTRIGNDEYHFQKNMFALISPQVVHDEKHTSGGDVLFIGFHSNQPALKHLNAVFHDDDDHSIQRLVMQMKDEFFNQEYGYLDMLNLLLDTLVIKIQRLLGVKKQPFQADSQLQLQYVINYMDEHYRQKISVESLAQLSGYSYDRFRHVFKEKYGRSPLQYLINRRIDYAKSLLLETNLLVSDIAHHAGFANDVQFCNMFKRETGKTPRAYRKQAAQKDASVIG